MSGALTPITRWVILNDGAPVPGAKLYTYLSGTSTPHPVYNHADLDPSHAHTNPVVADADGVLPVIYLDAVSYKFLVTDADGTTVFAAQDDVFDYAQTIPPSQLAQTVEIQAGTPYSLTFPNADAVGALQSDGAGTLAFGSLSTLAQTFTVDANTPYDLTWPNADAAGVLASNGSGVLSLTPAPTLTTPTMTIPVVSTRINLTGGQIAFPGTAVPSSDANTLDDYEEGTWTPVLGGSGGQSGQAYDSQHGEYVKIGRIVFCTATITLSAKGTITGDVVLSGLPFSVDTSADSACCFGDFDATATPQVWVAGIIGAAGYVQLRNRDSASTSMGSMDTSDISNTTACEAMFYYLAAS